MSAKINAKDFVDQCAFYIGTITRFITSGDEFDKTYRDSWLLVFLTMPGQFNSRLEATPLFSKAKDEFNKDPVDTVEKIWAFVTDVFAMDITQTLMLRLSQQSESYRECWYNLHGTILRAQEDNADLGTGLSDGTIATDSLGPTGDEGTYSRMAADSAKQFATLYNDKYAAMKQQIWSKPTTHSEAIASVFKDAYEVWPEQMKYLYEYFKSIPSLIESAFTDLSNFPLAQLCARNIDRFAVVMTDSPGLSDLGLGHVFKKLKQQTDERREQWKVVYQELDTLRAINEEQQRLLTCLEYRHVLEHLPPARLTGNATDRWQKLWDEVVHKELDLLFQGNIGPRTMTSLFKDKVDKLSAAKKTAVQTEIARQQGIPQPVQNVALEINRQPGRAPQDKILYKEWPGYRRGQDMYSELSHSIHSFGDRYKIRKTNWPLMDLQLLQWLQPTRFVGVDDEEDVDWDGERRDRNIPA